MAQACVAMGTPIFNRERQAMTAPHDKPQGARENTQRYSVVNGKLMVSTATARIEVTAVEAAKLLNHGGAQIVGWMVGMRDNNPAMYNLAQQKEAYEAARRWNRPIAALIVHSGVPDYD
jgi:hypothetical protein